MENIVSKALREKGQGQSYTVDGDVLAVLAQVR